jgi:hypothetical protein
MRASGPLYGRFYLLYEPSTTGDALEPLAAVNRWSSPYSQIILRVDIGRKIYRNTYTKPN